jgi:Family of unknown function (DUF5675)
MGVVVLKLKRKPGTFNVGNVIGRWGTMTVNGTKTFDTIERGGGYVSIPPGTYTCHMYIAPILVRHKVMNGRCLWPRGHNVRNNKGNLAGILIHKGHRPHDVLGCIAVGKKYNWGRMHKSEEAINYIFQQMGGWARGKSNCKLVVENR